MKSLLCFLALIPIATYGQPATKHVEVRLPALHTPERWMPSQYGIDIKAIHVARADIRPGGSIPLASVRSRLRVADTITRIELVEQEEYCWFPTECVYLEVRNMTPYNDVNDWVATNTNVYQLQRGAPFIVSGGRPGEILYVIDGVQVARW